MNAEIENPAFSGSASRWPGWFVAVVWAAMAGSTLAYVYRYAFTSPWADEMRWVGVITGAEPLTAAWIFQSYNQHCFPVVKLVYLATGWAGNFDFRGPAFLNVILLAAVALAMMLVAARIRGQASVLDALIPIALLHWGHYMNLIWGDQLLYVLPTVLACILLLLISRNRPQASVAGAGAASLCAMAAALCGGPGVFYLPAAWLWLVYAGVRRWRDGRGAAIAILSLAAFTLLPLALWLPTLSVVASGAETTRPGVGVMLRGTLEFLSMSPGKFGGELYPASGLVVVAILAIAARVLYVVWRRQPQERLRAAGFGLFLCGAVSMALGIGITRGAIGCLWPRYIILGSPLILCLYLIGVSYGPEIRRSGIRWACAVALIVIACLYNVKGLRHTIDLQWNVQRMEDAVAEGLPIEAVAARNCEDMQDPPKEALAGHLEMLRAAGLGPYRAAHRRAPARDVVVAPMLFLKTPRTPSGGDALSDRDQLVQPFVAVPGLPLYRIDVETYCRDRSPAQVRWAVDEVDPNGRRRTRAQGDLASVDRPDPRYISLVFEPFSVGQGNRLELRIRADGGNKTRPQVPLYAIQSDRGEQTGVLGFLFYERQPASTH